MFKINSTDELLAVRGPDRAANLHELLGNHLKYIISIDPDSHGSGIRMIDRPGKIVKHSGNNHVFCWTPRLSYLIEEIDNLDITQDDILLVGASDYRMSKQYGETYNKLLELKPRFKKIYLEGKDIECDWINVLPNCLNTKYFKQNVPDNIVRVVNSPLVKTKLIGTAFGKFCGADPMGIRTSLSQFCENHKFIENFFCPPDEYYRKLSHFKFFISPEGWGAQCSKLYEAILTNTVAVVMNTVTNQELKSKYNFPLLIVDDWKQLNKDMLVDVYNNEFRDFDWDSVKNLFTIDGFTKRILGSSDS